jgi:hypothetical protein
MAIEDEIGRWKSFRNTLPDEEDKQAFDVLMDMCRNHASAGSCACKPIIFEPMAISILLAQQKEILQLERRLTELLMLRSGGHSHG